MVNTQYLEQEIEKSGKKKNYLADKCGLSRQSFRAKCQNRSEFTAKHIAVLCDELSITSLRKKDDIFFATEVEKNGN